MSRIAKNSIKIDKDIQCNFNDGVFFAKGKLGEMKLNVKPSFTIKISDDEVVVVPKNDDTKKDPNWGTIRALVANIIYGVSKGFTKTLELNGTGYRASVAGSTLKLQLGYSHDVNFDIPKEVKIECPKQNIINLSSFDKEKLGAAAAKIRSFRKPEPFKGKGIKYSDEFIFRKEGKKK